MLSEPYPYYLKIPLAVENGRARAAKHTRPEQSAQYFMGKLCAQTRKRENVADLAHPPAHAL